MKSRNEHFWRTYWQPGEADRFRDAVRAVLGKPPVPNTTANRLLRNGDRLELCARFCMPAGDGGRRIAARSIG